jgi:small-conductance mechanosensitive channel
MGADVVILFLKKYWTHIVVAIVVAAGLLYINGLRLTIEQQRTEIVRLEGQVTQLTTVNTELQSANAALAASLKTQTASIKAMVAESEAKVKASAEAVREARAQTERLQKKYASLLNAPPSVTGDMCASTTILLEQYVTLRRGELQP